VLGEEPYERLIEIVLTNPRDIDPGVRLRAYRAMELYPETRVEEALAAAIEQHRRVRDGINILHLRAAMHSFAVIAGARAIQSIRPVLDHNSKDARAAAAEALAATGSPAARPPLYQRLNVESDQMVKLALTDAIRRLSGSAK